jgi:hypothetical protein
LCSENSVVLLNAETGNPTQIAASEEFLSTSSGTEESESPCQWKQPSVAQVNEGARIVVVHEQVCIAGENFQVFRL